MQDGPEDGCGTPLHRAAAHGALGEARSIIATSEGLEMLHIQNEAGLTPLHLAAECGHAEVVAQLLQASPSAASLVNRQCREGCTALILATYQGHAAAVLELLKLPECRLDIANKDQDTALQAAAYSCHAGVVLRLLKAHTSDELDAALRRRDESGHTPLWTAACYGKTNIVELLLAAMPDPAAISIPDKWGLMPLHAAADAGHAAVVAQILQASPSAETTINLQTDEGQTAIMFAAKEGHVAAVDELLRVPECRLGLRCKLSKTAADYAAANGHAEVTQNLKRHRRHHSGAGSQSKPEPWSGMTEVHLQFSINHPPPPPAGAVQAGAHCPLQAAQECHPGERRLRFCLLSFETPSRVCHALLLLIHLCSLGGML